MVRAPRVDRIRHVGGAGANNGYTYYPVVIIGAGESGIAMGCRLRSVLGFDQFRIIERRPEIAGTWTTNTYPGIACDVLAQLYSYSWAQNPLWSDLLPPGPEIARYLYDVCEKFQIIDKIQLDTSVRSTNWIENDEEWEVTLDHLAPGVGDMSSNERAEYAKTHGEGTAVLRTEKIRAKIVISACGGLVEPRPFKNLPGLDSFQGDIMHTARWDKNVPLKDKSIVVVGTGCSAAQVVPQLIKPHIGAKKVTQLMRSPPWMVPFITPEGRKVWRKWVPRLNTYIPGFQDSFRKLMFTFIEAEWYMLFAPTEKARQNRAAKSKELLAYMRKTAPEKYHDILTPNYEVFCKRRVVDDGWFGSLHDPRIELTTQFISQVNATSVTLGPGRHYPPESDTSSKHPTAEREIDADVIVMANGYETNAWLHPLTVYGRDGKSLEEVWKQRGGAQAYMGLAMDGFPNFFFVFGPNTVTGHTSVIIATENAVNYILKLVKGIVQGDVRTYEVKESAERQWTNWTQAQLKNSLYNSGGCGNWYVNPKTGWNSSTYPSSQIDASIRHMFVKWWDWDAVRTRKGTIKLGLGRLLKLFALVTAVYGAYYRLKYGRVALQGRVKEQLAALIGVAQRVLESSRTRVGI
jgi:cation diffusion facilitator CzcD-associated flavoprotein CzcO